MGGKNVREELAGLTEAVRGLRDREVAGEIAALRAEVEKLRAEKALHHCHGCACVHVTWTGPAWTPAPTWTYPVITCGGPTGGTVSTTSLGITGTVTTGSTLMLGTAAN